MVASAVYYYHHIPRWFLNQMSIIGLYSWAKPNIFFNCRSFLLCLMSYMCLPKWWYPQMRVMKSKQILARLFLTWYLSMASKCSQYWVPFHQLMQARWLHLPVEDDLWGRAFRWLLLLVDFVLVLPLPFPEDLITRIKPDGVHWQEWAELSGWRMLDYMVSLVPLFFELHSCACFGALYG